jgi:hypothetical protein
MNFTLRLGAAIAGTLVLGCGLTASGPEVDRIEAIDLAPARLSLQPSQSAELTLVVITSRGNSGATASLVWSATGGVITGNFIVDGVRHLTYQSPAQPGNYLLMVTAATGSPADTTSVAVTTTPLPVNAVTVTPGTVSLALGDTTILRATLTESSGSVVVGRAIEWSSSDAGVATVLATGFVRAMGVGTATITATSEGHSGTSLVTVTPAPGAAAIPF